MTQTQTQFTVADTGPLAGETRMLIDGALVDASDGQFFEVTDPSTGQVAGMAANGTPEDMDRAIAAARRAFDDGVWSNDSAFRARCLGQLHTALTEDLERLRRVIVTESGSPVALTRAVQLVTPLQDLAHWAEVASNFQYEHVLDDGGDGTRRLLRYEPTGVVGAITPWNYPFYLNLAETAPALAAGNTVVLKPAQLTPWSATEIGRAVAERTDIPAGVLNIVSTATRGVSSQLTRDPRVDMVSFTGSTATGKQVIEAAASTIKKVFLELGGKSAHIVLDDADFERVLPPTAFAICSHSGQGCTLSSRVLLPRSRYEEGLEILAATFRQIPIGDVWHPGVLQGPQVSADQRDKVLRLINSGRASGGRVLVGGGIPADLPMGYYVEPTLIADVDPMSELAQEEVFGPVLVVIPYDTVDEAIAISNSTIYGLAGEVSSASNERALSVARRMRTGNVAVNGVSYFGVRTPLGGYRQSGLGRRNGDEGFKEYMELKAMGLPG
jgi:acyl-CoA reductase-like NAD-dependent aldehyde dehydrogenase